ncbi:MAG: succinylglutamate desuccinylase/aspartoacylase family protein [Burkholderiaceae bacterium]
MSTPGTQHQLTVLRYGQADAQPKIYLQASLHADEVPGMLVLHHLRTLLATLEGAGQIKGEIVLVPSANPLGLAQHVHGSHLGRFHLADGVNFNRGFPNLIEGVAARVGDQLGGDAQLNRQLIRSAARAELAATPAHTEHEQLKHLLLGLALDADVVLDLHCDSEAVVHLYCGTPLVTQCAPLAQLMGARAMLYAHESGDDPFDEACARLWWELAARFPSAAIEPACLAVTVELRGETDVGHATAKQDARALLSFMTLRGAIEGVAAALPAALCEPTPLAGSEPLTAPHSGVVVFHRAPGDIVQEGEAVADVIDPISGALQSVKATTSGILYARIASRFATAGRRLGKIAGTRPTRSGKLLSP